MGTDEEGFVGVLVSSPPEHLRIVAAAYEKKYGESLVKAAAHDFSCHAEKAVLFLIRMITEPLELLAELFESAMKGFNTDENALRSAVVRYYIVLRDIKPVYKKKYGKELRERIAEEVGGDYGELLLSVSTPAISLKSCRARLNCFCMLYLMMKSIVLNVTARCSERFEDDCRFLVRSSLCYYREGTRNSILDVTTRAIQRAVSSFRVLEPLRARVRLQHVATKLFTSFELVSNPFLPLVLVDSHVQWPERGHDAPRLFVVETYPNTNLRGTRLCPNAELQLAFTLATSPAFNQATYDTCHWKLALQDGEDDATWHQTTMVVPISLTEVTGTLYRIDIGHEKRTTTFLTRACPTL
ncbi:hypothetical protein PsorP6_013283 [Peronosclerospora sorghi]|uniref:Uncharacterized protein n=1 Tax=Peronosclerospora sorghi TaxID=230839 RepID=A0ACC0WIA9_9STRA|nr:hypothetical protein PsorP6_013283 [Peronosclerospora sorghi]